MTENSNCGQNTRHFPLSCKDDEIVESGIETLDTALNRLRAYCDVLDWLLVHPPEEPELMCMTVDEIRHTLGMALSARDTLLRARLARW